MTDQIADSTAVNTSAEVTNSGNAAPVVTTNTFDATTITNPAPTSRAWHDGFAPQDVEYLKTKGWDAAEGHKSLYDSYRNIEKLIGVKPDQLLKMPDANADQSAWNDFYGRLGRPEAADKYDFKPGDEKSFTPERLAWFREQAHQMGLNNSQFTKFMQSAEALDAQTVQKAKQDYAENASLELDNLRREWGSEYDAKHKIAQNGLEAFLKHEGVAEAVPILQEIMGHATTLKLFALLGKPLGEHFMNANNSQPGENYVTMSKEYAARELKKLDAELGADRKRFDALSNPKSPDAERREALMQIAFRSQNG